MLTLGVITDLHFGPNASYEGKLRKLSHRAPELTRAFAERMRESVHPDLVVNLGDAIEDESPEADATRYAECLELLRGAAALTPEVRADIVRLREVVASVHDHVSKPSGTAEKYEEALLSCRSHVRGLSDRLSAALDLRLPDPSDVR